MEEEQSYKYYVVQLVNPPHEHFDKYVCVPDSWIILREITDQTAVIKYPVEEMSETKKRVMNNETYSADWTIFVANVKYGTNSYKDAKNYITVLNNRLIQEQSYLEIEDEGNILSKSGVKSPASQSGLSEINKPETSGASCYGENPTANNTMPNQLPITDFDLENGNKTENVNEITKSVKGRRYLTRRAYRLSQMSKHEQAISTGTVLDRNTITPEKSTEYFYDYTGKSCSQENTLDMNHDTSDLENELTNPEICRKPIFGSDFSDLLKEMYSSLENMHLMYDRISQVYLKHCSDISEMIRLVERFNNFYADPIAANSEEVTATVLEVNVEDEKTEAEKILDVVEDKTTAKGTIPQRISKRKKQTVNGEDDDDDDSDDSDYDNFRCIARKRRCLSHKFTLPPEYDENDSRWTLRYREKMDGLVELMPNSGVYVDTGRFSKCKELAKDSKTLARMLIMEVFTENALRTCSITGKKTNSLNIDKADVRPGLDKNARTALLNFVQQHGRDRNWLKLDTQHILSNIRTTIQKMRV